MLTFRQQIGKLRLQLRGKNHVIGWEMTPAQVRAFFASQGKTVLTLFGYSSVYEEAPTMLQIVRKVLADYSPASTLVNIGVTVGGIGAAYPLIKSLGFATSGIVSTLALDDPESISPAVDYICFVSDPGWGGKLPGSEQLSPTSEAMVTCSDILIGVGGGEISRDEMQVGRALGKPVTFYPAEINHAWAIQRAARQGLPPPTSFNGPAHELFGPLSRAG